MQTAVRSGRRASHEQLNVAESGFAIHQIDALQFNLQFSAPSFSVCVTASGLQLLVAVTRLDVMHGHPGDVFARRVVALFDLRRLQYVMAAALLLLREGVQWIFTDVNPHIENALAGGIRKLSLVFFNTVSKPVSLGRDPAARARSTGSAALPSALPPRSTAVNPASALSNVSTWCYSRIRMRLRVSFFVSPRRCSKVAQSPRR
jgi:hypothetical protein